MRPLISLVAALLLAWLATPAPADAAPAPDNWTDTYTYDSPANSSPAIAATLTSQSSHDVSGVLTRRGGGDALRATGAFHSVVVRPQGGAVLQATDRLSEYHGDAGRRVFDALGPALPEKAPWPDKFYRFKLIYEARSRTPWSPVRRAARRGGA